MLTGRRCVGRYVAPAVCIVWRIVGIVRRAASSWAGGVVCCGRKSGDWFRVHPPQKGRCHLNLPRCLSASTSRPYSRKHFPMVWRVLGVEQGDSSWARLELGSPNGCSQTLALGLVAQPRTLPRLNLTNWNRNLWERVCRNETSRRTNLALVPAQVKSTGSRRHLWLRAGDFRSSCIVTHSDQRTDRSTSPPQRPRFARNKRESYRHGPH